MIHQNVLFCKVKLGTEDRVKSSAKGNNLEVLALDGTNCLLKFKGSFEQSQLPNFISRLKNSMLFSNIVYTRNAFVGRG